jgi:iron(III) transport system substrate-binding protein
MVLIGCSSSTPTNPDAEVVTENNRSLTVYSGRGAVLVDPLFALFTEETGIKVNVRYDKSTETLANRIATEGSETEADVFLAQDSGYLGALAQKSLLIVLPESTTSQIDEAYRTKDAHWVATSGRARVLVYSPERVTENELPKSLSELADAKFKGRLGWAPQNSSFQAHVSALRSLWGDEKTADWLQAVQALEPTVYPKNSPQVQAVSNGEIDIGWVNHYYLHKLKAADPSLAAANYSFSELGDAGNLMMLSGAGILTHSDDPELALQLVSFLVSEKAQLYFTEKVYEYPTRAGIAHHPDVPELSDRLVTVDQQVLTDIGPTLALLRELGLQ